jgi:hypothetical protein
MAHAAQEFNYYDVLGLEATATDKQIRNAYRRVAMKHHPDKNPSEEGLEIFSRCAQAYEVLSDPVSRSMYDMVIGVKPESDDEMRRINKIKREAAGKAVELMEESVEASRAEEMEKQGLVILEARYGDLASARAGAWINVTVPLQCMVDSSVLVLPAGASKAWLEGFYDPCPGEEKYLRVRYKFLDMLHQCEVHDEDELCLPLQEHMVDEEAEEAAAAKAAHQPNFRQKRALKRQVAQVKRRRRWVFFTALAMVAGFFFARHQGVFEDPSVRERVASISPMLLRLLGPGADKKRAIVPAAAPAK